MYPNGAERADFELFGTYVGVGRRAEQDRRHSVAE